MRTEVTIAPFTDEQVKNINEMQQHLGLMTCMGHEGCNRPEDLNYGTLTANNENIVCQCGKYKQDWCETAFADGRMLRAQLDFEKEFKKDA